MLKEYAQYINPNLFKQRQETAFTVQTHHSLLEEKTTYVCQRLKVLFQSGMHPFYDSNSVYGALRPA